MLCVCALPAGSGLEPLPCPTLQFCLTDQHSGLLCFWFSASSRTRTLILTLRALSPSRCRPFSAPAHSSQGKHRTGHGSVLLSEKAKRRCAVQLLFSACVRATRVSKRASPHFCAVRLENSRAAIRSVSTVLDGNVAGKRRRRVFALRALRSSRFFKNSLEQTETKSTFFPLSVRIRAAFSMQNRNPD